jgi:uncharacterized protein YdeI (YjbR/CyaY-like superfamily)
MTTNTQGKLDLPIKSFKSADAFEKWLARNHSKSRGIWLRFFKKNSGIKSVYYPEALDIALCYGWIDALVKKFDELSYLQRFTPRRPRSGWSKRNVGHVKRLTKEGRMQAAGLAQVAAAKRDGRWKVAYESPRKMKIPQDFFQRLAKDPKASAFFQTLNKQNQYAIAWRLQTARNAEIRERRMHKILQMLASGTAVHAI